MADLRISKAVIGVIEETTTGTYLAPTDKFYAHNLVVPDIAPNFLTSRNANGSLTNTKSGNVIAENEVSITFDIPVLLENAGIEADPYLQYVDLFNSANISLTASAAAITAALSDVKNTVSFCYNIEGREYQVRGAVGNAKLMWNSGENAAWQFELKGILSAVATETAPTGTVTEYDFFVVQGCTISTVGGVVTVVDKCEIAMNSESTAVKALVASRGVSHFVNTARKPVATLTGVDLGDLTLYTAGTNADLALSIANGTGDYIINISATAVVSSIKVADENGLARENITLDLLATSGTTSELTVVTSEV